MFSVENIAIDGQLSSIGNPVVANLRPTITWDIDDNNGTSNQVSFDIRIANSSTSLGLDAFGGNLLQDHIDGTANTYEYVLYNLERGQQYYGQIRAYDAEERTTSWSTFQFQINQLPFVLNYFLSPTLPRATDDIELNYTYFDPDDHTQHGTKIRWFKNNIPQSKYDDLCILPSSAINPGESWSARVTPCDGLEYGPIVETASVTVSESDSGFTSITILPYDANVDDILHVTYVLSDDTEYVSVEDTATKVEYLWYVNNVLVSTSNNSYIRLPLTPGDIVSVLVRILDSSDTLMVQGKSLDKSIDDVGWYVYDLGVSGIADTDTLNDLEPTLEWKIHKTTADAEDLPAYLQVLITKTPSVDEPLYDSYIIEYNKNSFIIPAGVLTRGQQYYVHVGASDDTEISDDLFASKKITTAGSSWETNVDNEIGWTVECKVQLETDTLESNLGVYIHDGTYYCAVTFGINSVSILSTTSLSYNYPSAESDLRSPKTFRISGQGQSVRVFVDNKLAIDATDFLSNQSQLKQIVYGDVDSKTSNQGIFRFFRYSTNGAYGISSVLPDQNKFLFAPIGHIPGGSAEYLFENLISWLPDDTSKSGQLIMFNENSSTERLPTVTKNYSPITCIYINEQRNKYIGTTNGVVIISGDKHDFDYSFSTDVENLSIPASDFDRISTVDKTYWDNVETNNRSNWFTLDTTYRAVPAETTTNFDPEDEYDPYTVGRLYHAIHYYSQRTFGHAWYDNVDNKKGWSVYLSLDVETVEADDFQEEGMEKHGFGVYVNDGTYQEIIYFYEDRIRLYYANVYVPINTKISRQYVITGKDNNILIYQRLDNANTPYFLLANGAGLFTTSAVKTGNSRKPNIVLDKNGVYHCVWHDDSTKRSQIFYSYYSGSSWSTPELVTETTQFNLSNPRLDVDDLNRIWVAYEDTSWGLPEISVSVRDRAGWNPKTRVTNKSSHKANPDIKVDTNQNVHLVWEDNRDGHWQIWWAEWINSKQAWMSSAQFGSDTSIVQADINDPYQFSEYGLAIDFKQPKLSSLNDFMWVVCEGHFSDNTSAIYRGFRNLVTGSWNSAGAINTDADGNTIFGTGFLTSLTGRVCLNPSVAAHPSKNIITIIWEDNTEPISQIWGAAIDSSNSEITSGQITNQTQNCTTPCVGWVGDHAVIVFEKDNGIYLSYFNGILRQFFGSATGGEDRYISIASTRRCFHPSMGYYTPSTGFRLVFDCLNDRDPSQISSVEFPDFYVIGDALIEHSSTNSSALVTSTRTLSNGLVGNNDTKEFAFGDLSENIGLKVHWKNISMYFGYDAKPYSFTHINTDTVPKWPDNRINDVFTDVFGNVVAATFGGLSYYNTSTGQLTNIDGHTSTFDPDTGCTNDTCLLHGKLTTAVKWGKNGVWYVGTTQGAFFSRSAGKVWEKLFPDQIKDKIVSDITVDRNGRAILAAYKQAHEDTDGIFIAHPDMPAPINIVTPNQKIKSVAIDDNDIIWAGSDSGLYRIESFSSANMLTFGRKQGMRSSHVNDIAIVDSHLRYIATASGIERMNGMRFTNFSVHTHGLLNNNIAALEWDSRTNSLWCGSLYKLHEIVFRDPAHDIIENEIVHYDSSEIGTDQVYDKRIYYVLDFEEVQNDPENPLHLTTETSSVYINKNKVDFGYSVNEAGQFISFLCDLLIDDEVEIELTNKFSLYHDFSQTNIEREVLGEKRSNIIKLDRTSRNQLLLLSGLQKPSVLMDAGKSNFPFATIFMDRESPVGCIQKLTSVSKNTIRFRLLAYDRYSGIDGFMLSNYENFTSDGTTPLEFQDFATTVEHDIGNDLTNVITSLTFPSTVTIGGTTYNVGEGSSLTKWTNTSTNKNYLVAATSKPCITFIYDPTIDEWTATAILDSADTNRQINELKNIDNTIWALTGNDQSFGAIYRSANGSDFNLVAGITGKHARGIAKGPDGTVYIGSSDGSIYAYKNNILSVAFENIGQAVYGLSVSANTLIVSTGNQGRVFSIDLTTNSSITILDSGDDYINNVLIDDTITDQSKINLFAASGSDTVIYRAHLGDLNFTKSFNSFGKTVYRLKLAQSVTLLDPDDRKEVTGNTVIAAIGTDIFKYASPGWEFVYRNTEDIRDLEELTTDGSDGIWLISRNKVMKWTAVRNSKIVYLKLRDRAGNTSTEPITGGEYTCPNDKTEICCNYAYSINIKDLQNFVNESRIVDIDEYGAVVFAYDSPNTHQFFSAHHIDEEIGVYASEIFNGSNNLVSWRSITWDGTEPVGTSISMQIRSGATESALQDEDWSSNLDKDARGLVSLEHISDQYLQFRAILKSSVRDMSPTLTSVTIRNLTAEASHFFTTNFALTSRPIKGLLTANTFLPISADVVFGIDTKNSVNFSDYQLIEPNRLFTTDQNQFGTNIRIGAKLLTPSAGQISSSHSPGDPYDASSYVCSIGFTFSNTGPTASFHFRIRFFNDTYRTQLVHTFFSGNDQTGWTINSTHNYFPSTGISIATNASRSAMFTPGDMVEADQKWYITIDAYNGSAFETIIDDRSYICATCNISNEPGLIADYYGDFSSLSVLPDFSLYRPHVSTIDDIINFQPKLTSWITSRGQDLGSLFVNRFAIRWRGKILAPSTGNYGIKVVSDDGSKLFIDTEEIIDFDGLHPAVEATTTIDLDEGFHDVELQYFANLGTSYCQLHWIPPGSANYVPVPAANLFHSVASEYCEDTVPKIFNLALVFELENGETIKLNLD